MWLRRPPGCTIQPLAPCNFSMKLLVIEDEPKTANFLKRGFSEAGFVVDVAPDGGAALRLIQARLFDLIVLDLMLPGMHGFRVGLDLGCYRLRSALFTGIQKTVCSSRTMCVSTSNTARSVSTVITSDGLPAATIFPSRRANT